MVVVDENHVVFFVLRQRPTVLRTKPGAEAKVVIRTFGVGEAILDVVSDQVVVMDTWHR